HLYLLDDTHRHPPSSPNKSTRTSGQQAGYLHNPTNLKDVPLAAAGLPWKGGQTTRALGRFEAETRNELWTGDALHGPLIDGRRVFLFAFIDDHSRLLAGYRWAAREDVLNASRALRAGITSRGLPGTVYVDNGSPFVSGQLLRACAVLGIRLIHSRPGRPEGRGKIERVFRTIREQVLVELEDHPLASLEELSRVFQAWD
ncbi:MAG: DDE-type integrase/transposase/recombinase, partial [Solirubrobacteraceae bacterium]